MKPSAKEHSCGLREDVALGAVSAVSGAFVSHHGNMIQQALLFCQEKSDLTSKLNLP